MDKFSLQAGFAVWTALFAAEAGFAAFREAHVEDKPVVQISAATVKGKAPSLLPPGKAWKLVWHDEFDGREIDKTKWMCRESFWGQDFPAFAHDFEGVEMTGETVRLHLLRKGDDFTSPHLQTGSLTYDIPKDSDGFWPFGVRRKPLFMKRYGYFEIRCRLPKYPGWHAAFWLQAPGVGSHPDPAVAGVETDIMENYRQHTHGKMVGGNGWGGYGKDSQWFGHFQWTHEETPDGWHSYGCEWSPSGYTFYCDGKKVGEQNAPVSQVPEFLLVSTEPGGYRKCAPDGGLTAGRKIREWGKPDPRLFDVKLPDFFEVDFVRVYSDPQVDEVATLPYCVDGIYPHLAMFNDEGECGTGAVVPWAGSLWAVTYGPHCPLGSSDRLYEIRPDLTRIVRPESVGGTPANRLIHRETNQLLIGPYVIDAKGNVRVVPPARMPGRLTGAARHLTDPSNRVYVATMESGLYELDLRTLAVNTLVREREAGYFRYSDGLPALPAGWNEAPLTRVPGYHSKGLASGFGRVYLTNNGEDSDEARRNPFVASGALADWSAPGRDWRTIRRCQFTEVTTRDGICGNEHPDQNPVWSLGWDAKSVILAVTTNGADWAYYRLPKASHCYDGAHGWNTEWPRIRDVGFGDGTLLATMHGTFWRFPADFSPARPDGIRPISTYLKVIGDFCRWGERIVFGCDDQAKNEFLGKRTLKKGAPKRDRSQSNLWFVRPEDLAAFGPPSGEGWVWLKEDVKAGDVSDPYLHAGYETMDFAFTDADGRAVPHELLRDGDWVRVKALADAKGANAHFVYGPSRPASPVKPVGTVDVYDDYSQKTYSFPNVNGDTTVICREVATERDLLYAGGVFYEVPADNAGGFAALRPVALANGPVWSIEARLGLVFVNGRPRALDSLWRNGTAAKAYWLWRDWTRLPVR